ncbi:MAG: Fpg/Nei family DNA glycosylase [Acidimicrobiaceae bacterium]|nr:Fpg/Nei family DNA glycosylase [Acidimicrobiaceae bacterium]MYC41449.1 Fpg/Nei family DNA glycosylase [Acidimicrobiaceae bacterium]MYH88115.1 Fpg/Nei family DNA glycosylase [Acidimicrobiaceae bacterium]
MEHSMFELPEVETVRRDLERDIVGKKIKSAEAMSMKVLRRYRTRNSFVSRLVGNKITAVQRRGLHITIEFENESNLVVDLGSSGSLRRTANKEAIDPETEVVITFTQHGQLRLLDAQGTSEIFVVDDDSILDELPELEELGLDPVSEPVTWTVFGRSLLQRRVRLKTLLTDPTFVVGIGDIYADEILFHAGLRHNRMSDSLTSQEIRRLHRALVGTLHDAIKHRGTSIPEREFIDPVGNPGEYGSHLMVWGRHGELSARSRLPIQRVKFRGTWTYFCQTQV